MKGRTKGPAPRPARSPLADKLRSAILESGASCYAIAAASGVDQGVISRFLSGTRDLRLATADRLAVTLGLRLVETAARGPKARKGPAAGPSPLGAARPAIVRGRAAEGLAAAICAAKAGDVAGEAGELGADQGGAELAEG